jgi:hypothetical protein
VQLAKSIAGTRIEHQPDMRTLRCRVHLQRPGSELCIEKAQFPRGHQHAISGLIIGPVPQLGSRSKVGLVDHRPERGQRGAFAQHVDLGRADEYGFPGLDNERRLPALAFGLGQRRVDDRLVITEWPQSSTDLSRRPLEPMANPYRFLIAGLVVQPQVRADVCLDLCGHPVDAYSGDDRQARAPQSEDG